MLGTAAAAAGDPEKLGVGCDSMLRSSSSSLSTLAAMLSLKSAAADVAPCAFVAAAGSM